MTPIGAPSTHHPQLVWYVAYGSNLSADRFRRYLDAARDTSAPRDWRPVRLPYALYFAQWSDAWGNGGGVAFVDHDIVDPPPTLGRAWLVSAEQFADVFAMENGLVPGSFGEHDVTDRWYGRRVLCGELDGSAMVTFTAPWPRASVQPTVPSAAYVDTIVRGLDETHGLGRADAMAYLGVDQLRP